MVIFYLQEEFQSQMETSDIENDVMCLSVQKHQTE